MRAATIVVLGLAWLAAADRGAAPLRILSIMTIDTMSHHRWLASLTVELARRGHHVTSVDVDKPAEMPATLNVTIIETAFAHKPDLKLWQTASVMRQIYLIHTYQAMECESDLRAPALQRLLDPANEQEFDLILLDYMTDCMLGFAHRFGYPGVVAVSPFPGFHLMDDLMGNPALPGVLPMTMRPYAMPMALWQRAATAALHAWSRLCEAWHRSWQDRVIREVFGPDAPTSQQLRSHVHVALVNENPVLEQPRPMPPSMVAVGGMHVKAANLSGIPADLRAWLDGAEDGFLLVSFGSIMKAESLDHEKLLDMVAAFGALGAKVRVLWKIERGALDDASLPGNVWTDAWLPQNDILGHPKLLLFVTHCGGLSTQEASYHGVPMLGVPFIVDQFNNLDKVERLGVGRRMPFAEITKERLLAEVLEMLRNPTYRERARRVATLLRDVKETPLERAVWWAEYVGRHRGAPHLRSPALDVAWPHTMLLDVIALTVVVVLAVVFVVVAALGMCCRRCCGRRAAPRPPNKGAKKE